MPHLIHGSAHRLPEIADKSVHLIATSPPYYGLRAYSGDQAIEWQTVEYAPMAGQPIYDRPRAEKAWLRMLANLPDGLTDDQIDDIRQAVFDEFIVDMLKPPLVRVQGCEPGCAHEWIDVPPAKPGQVPQTKWVNVTAIADGQRSARGAYCIHCGGWRGGLGLEPTIEAYIGHLILCLREWWRVLRDDGLCFVNLGSSYANKQDQMIPARFALAAQADGWFLRSRPPWIKRNSMPESVTDRPSTSHEEWFMLAKSENYFWDIEAVKMPHSITNGWYKQREQGKGAATKIHGLNHDDSQTLRNDAGRVLTNDYSGRNRRTGDWYFESLDIAIDETETWLNHAKQTRKHGGLLLGIDGDPAAFLVNPHPYKEAHFATFPQKMIEPIIRAGTSAHGCCAACGAPWARVVEREYHNRRPNSRKDGIQFPSEVGAAHTNGKGKTTLTHEITSITTGWQPTCSCYGHFEEVDDGSDWVTEETGIRRKRTVYVPDGPQPDPIPATVLDPFAGSGTTLRAAMKLGRNSIGVDISDQYLTDLVPERTSNIQMEMPL